MPDENNNGIPDSVEKLAGSLWKSRTMWLTSVMGLLVVVQEFGDFFPEKVVHGAALLSAVLIAVFRVQAQGTGKKAKSAIAGKAKAVEK